MTTHVVILRFVCLGLLLAGALCAGCSLYGAPAKQNDAAAAKDAPALPDPCRITVAADGAAKVNGKPVPLKALGETLRDAGYKTDAAIELAAHHQTDSRSIMKALDALGQAGFTRIIMRADDDG